MPKKVFKPASPSSAADNEELPALHKAIEDGNRAKVKRLLAAKADVNAPDAGGMKPLFYAVVGGNMEVIADLLAAKADVNAPDANGMKPLFYAVVCGNMEVIADLLAAKADVNAVVEIDDISGCTPLHCSVRPDYPAAIDILATSGANVNRRDSNGWTPLHWAAFFERPAVVRALIKHGANVNLGDNDKATPLHLAAQKNHFIVADILIDNRAKLNLADNHGDTPLHEAAWHGSSDTAESLIDAGANVSKKNKAGRTPLYIAQDRGHNKVADALIGAGNFGDMVAPSPEHKSIPERVYDKAWMSIVKIDNPDAEKCGSGVIIAPGIVATNLHVVEGGGDILVSKAENRIRISERDVYLAKPNDYSDSSDRDLCLLEVDGLECPPIKIRKYNTLGIGEDVYAIGNPAGLDLSLSSGIISQLRGEGHREIQTDAAISGGSSGGGLFDKDGNLVGITTRSEIGGNDPQNLNFAIPADWVLGYFAKLGQHNR